MTDKQPQSFDQAKDRIIKALSSRPETKQDWAKIIAAADALLKQADAL